MPFMKWGDSIGGVCKMISKKYVFILGAGASMPFGFPSGRQLIDGVNTTLSYSTRTGNINNAFVNLLIKRNHSLAEIDKFRNELQRSQINSVDAFIEHRPEFMELGKAVIGHVLLKAEK